MRISQGNYSLFKNTIGRNKFSAKYYIIRPTSLSNITYIISLNNYFLYHVIFILEEGGNGPWATIIEEINVLFMVDLDG